MKDMPTKDPSNWLALWAIMPEPIKAAILSVVLAVVMAFKKDGRSRMDKIIDAISGAVIVLIAGSAIELMGLSSGWTFVIAGAVGGYGTGQVKEWFRAWAEKKAGE